jgi:uncharacterized protein DUF6629
VTTPLRQDAPAAMCFSPEADFVSGAVIGLIGVATLTQAERAREVPLAALPLAFALHQVAEGFVWLGLQGRASPATGDAALHVYLVFAWVLLPVLAPLSILLIEPDQRRRRAMAVLTALGAVVGLFLLSGIARDTVTARIAHDTLQYRGVGGATDTVTVLYVIATCGTFVLSSHRRIVVFGLANLAAVGVIAWVQSNALTSLWCTWAAVVSVLIFLHFTDRRRVNERVVSAP